jgi:hypothetical protein
MVEILPVVVFRIVLGGIDRDRAENSSAGGRERTTKR